METFPPIPNPEGGGSLAQKVYAPARTEPLKGLTLNVEKMCHLISYRKSKVFNVFMKAPLKP